MNPTSDIHIGISSCLMGEPVRYDGGHRKHDDIVNVLGQRVTFVPVCPEFEVGMGVPRETLRLIGDPEAPRLVTTETGIDHTDRMLTFARERVRQLEAMDLSGYIFKSRSPSCGVERVEVVSEGGSRSGRGLFARVLMEHLPGMPVAEERHLSDPALLENFLARVLHFHRNKR
ncbi:MAG: DUF523 domain-containing protein [Candidatus Latescibacteria bacterium]|nr:DUF523 domain-containing protein [Candidatus Latescibacterota bacterium]